ncbi:MAG: hypothetical protein AB1938_12450 [Myxococcota bacterium]
MGSRWLAATFLLLALVGECWTSDSFALTAALRLASFALALAGAFIGLRGRRRSAWESLAWGAGIAIAVLAAGGMVHVGVAWLLRSGD